MQTTHPQQQFALGLDRAQNDDPFNGLRFISELLCTRGVCVCEGRG